MGYLQLKTKTKAMFSTAKKLLKEEMKEIYHDQEKEGIIAEVQRFDQLNKRKEVNDERIDEEILVIEENEATLKRGEPAYLEAKCLYEEAKANYEQLTLIREEMEEDIKKREKTIHRLKVKQRKIDEEQIRMEKMFENYTNKQQKLLETKGVLEQNPHYIARALKTQLVESYTHSQNPHIRESFLTEKEWITYHYNYLPDVQYGFVFGLEHEEVDVYVKTPHGTEVIAANTIEPRRNLFVHMTKEHELLLEQVHTEINELASEVIRFLKSNENY